jgi:hypothetical protein
MNRGPWQRPAGKGELLPEHPACDPLPILWATRLPVRISNRNRRKVALRMIARCLALFANALLFVSVAYSQAPQTLSVEPDSPRWVLQGQAKPVLFPGAFATGWVMQRIGPERGNAMPWLARYLDHSAMLLIALVLITWFSKGRITEYVRSEFGPRVTSKER